MVDTNQYLEILTKANTNLDVLNAQIQKAKVMDKETLVEYFQELRDIILKRYKSTMLELCNKPDEFTNERGAYFYR